MALLEALWNLVTQNSDVCGLLAAIIGLFSSFVGRTKTIRYVFEHNSIAQGVGDSNALRSSNPKDAERLDDLKRMFGGLIVAFIVMIAYMMMRKFGIHGGDSIIAGAIVMGGKFGAPIVAVLAMFKNGGIVLDILGESLSLRALWVSILIMLPSIIIGAAVLIMYFGVESSPHVSPK